MANSQLLMLSPCKQTDVASLPAQLSVLAFALSHNIAHQINTNSVANLRAKMLHWPLVYLGVGPGELYRQPHLLSAHALVLEMRAIATGRITPYPQLEIGN